jgi:hypothetical protein
MPFRVAVEVFLWKAFDRLCLQSDPDRVDNERVLSPTNSALILRISIWVLLTMLIAAVIFPQKKISTTS